MWGQPRPPKPEVPKGITIKVTLKDRRELLFENIHEVRHERDYLAMWRQTGWYWGSYSPREYHRDGQVVAAVAKDLVASWEEKLG